MFEDLVREKLLLLWSWDLIGSCKNDANLSETDIELKPSSIKIKKNNMH